MCPTAEFNELTTIIEERGLESNICSSVIIQ